jgi:hypothetical protein
MNHPSSQNDPTIVFIKGSGSAEPESVQLELVCRFYGFRLVSTSSPAPEQWNDSPPALVVQPCARAVE